MKILLIILGVIVLPIIIFAIYRLIAFQFEGRQHAKKQFKRIESLFNKLDHKKPISKEEIHRYAQDVRTREATFKLLIQYDQLDLFPKEYFTFEKAAESNLANWLEFPTELGAIPDEIVYLKKVRILYESENLYYHVFKFKTHPPHWAAKDGWSLGVVGPYLEESQPYDFPHATFSRIGVKFGDFSPEEEVKWVHENISLRK